MTTTPKTKNAQLTVADIEAGYDDPRWCGWGYLGERRREVESTGAGISDGIVAKADAYVLRIAAEKRWGRENLFAWLNSRPGRHYGDLAFGCGQVEPRSAHVASYFPTLTEEPS